MKGRWQMINIGSLLLRFISLILGIEENKSFPPPLTKDEEATLFEKFRQGDLSARDKIIEHNLRLVSHIIRKYYSSYEYPDELLSVGSLGLIKAVDSFNAGFGTRFATYCAKCVQNAILSQRTFLENMMQKKFQTTKNGACFTTWADIRT